MPVMRPTYKHRSSASLTAFEICFYWLEIYYRLILNKTDIANENFPESTRADLNAVFPRLKWDLTSF